MSDRVSNRAGAARDPAAGNWVAFALAGERFALPMEAIEAVEPPPSLAHLPHAAAALLGAGNFAGRIVPVLDLARLLGRRTGERAYDGSGEILRLRTSDGSVGLWVDRAERLIRADDEASLEGAALLDPAALLAVALAPPDLVFGPPAPLGDVAALVPPAPVETMAAAFIVVEVAGKPVQLPREAIVELIEAVPWARVPRAPAGLLGIGMLRGSALPILSMAALLGVPPHGAPGGFAVIELDRHRMLLGVDRIVGLRRAEANGPIDVAAMIPEELRQIVLGFPTTDDVVASATSTDGGETGEYLAFTVAGQDFAVPIACVERIIEARPLIALPQAANCDGMSGAPIVGVVEWSGRIVPAVALRSQREGERGDKPAAMTSGAYVILRAPDGLVAIGVDRTKQVVRLKSGNISPSGGEDGLIEAVAAPADGEPLRMIAVARLWSAA